MYLCNAGLGVSNNGKIHVNFTDCNERSPHDDVNGTVSQTMKDDASGAMQYTVAVVFVYSIAVLGVFGLGLYNRRKYRRYHVDNETRAFLKNYEDVRRTCEQRSRLGAIQALLLQLHNEPLSNCDYRKPSASANSLAFLAISLSSLNERETVNNTLIDGVNELTGTSDTQSTLNNVLQGERGGLAALSANKSENDTQQEHKVRNSSMRAKRTLLGSSRRSYKGCRRCWTRRGAVNTPDHCPCKFNETTVASDTPRVIEVVISPGSDQNNETSHRNSNNGKEEDNSCVSFV